MIFLNKKKKTEWYKESYKENKKASIPQTCPLLTFTFLTCIEGRVRVFYDDGSRGGGKQPS